MTKLSLCAAGALFACSNLFSQTPDWGEGRAYKNAKVKLTSGATLHAERLAVGSDEVLLTASSAAKPVAFPLKNVERVQIATGNHWSTGLVIGVLGGVLAYRIIQETYEKPRTSTYSEPGFTATITEKRIMEPGLKALIVCAPVGLGILIGSTIPGEYKTIYSAAPTSEKVTWHFALSRLGSQPVLGMQVNF